MSATATMRKTYSGLIGKSDIGKGKPANYDLPPADFTYGKSSGNMAEGAKEITQSWKIHTPTKEAVQKQNFKALNKMSIGMGLATSQNFRRFAQANEKRLVPNMGTHLVPIMLPDEDFAFGNPNRPSTPIGAVVSHDYGNVAASQTQDIYKSRVADTYVKPDTKPKSTKTVKLISETTAKKLEELNRYGSDTNLYKMKKFQGVQTKLNTINKGYIPANKRPQTASASLAGSSRKQQI